MKLPLVSSMKVIKVLMKFGFQPAPRKGKGSHKAYYRIDDDGKKYLVIVPLNDPIPRGTLISIIKQSGISRDRFIELFIE